MALIDGHILNSPMGGIVNPRLSLGLHAYGWDYWPHHDSITAEPLNGSVDVPYPVAANPRVASGHVAQSFSNDWYHRIHLIPQQLNLGNIITEKTEEVYVWNAHLEPIVLQGLTQSADAGLVLDGPDTFPMTFLAIQISRWYVTVDDQGVASIRVTLSWDFGVESVALAITGARVVLWPFAPNWRTPVDESLEGKTRIVRAHAGDEQRSMLRSEPRRYLEYEFSLKGTDAQLYDNMLFGWQNQPFAVPYWQFGQRLTVEAASETMTLSLDTSDRGFASEGLAVLFRSVDSYEVVEIAEDGVASDSLTLKRPTITAWPLGTKVYPVGVSLVEGTIPTTRHTDRVLTGRVSFLVEPVVNDSFYPDEPAPDTYNGQEIILKQPNWVSPLDNSSTYDRDLVDYSIGRVALELTVDTITLLRTYKWLFKSKAEARAFRAFLRRRRARLVPVYIPSWHDDLTLTLPIGASDVALVCRDRALVNFVGTHPARRHLMIRTRQNGHFLRAIQSVEASGTNEVSLVLDSALGVALNPSDIKAIHYVALYRFAADRVTLSWHTDKVASVEARFQLVKA